MRPALKKRFEDFLRWSDWNAATQFYNNHELPISRSQRRKIIQKIYSISWNIDCPHTQKEILEFINGIFEVADSTRGCLVEAGCYKGGSSSKFSLAANLIGRPLYIFDSFAGIPPHTEPHSFNIYNRPVSFSEGEYKGSFEEVSRNLKRFGHKDSCRLVPGWLKDTLPKFNKKISAIYLDVDLAQSTRTCLKYLYPLLEKGGLLFSQDGHLPLVIEVFQDSSFWENELGTSVPEIEGLGKRKLLRMIKN